MSPGANDPNLPDDTEQRRCSSAAYSGGNSVYWLFVAALIAGFALLWIVPFADYYGWQADDWMGYRKAMATLDDWRAAFKVRINLLQPYFYLYSYLPLWLGPDLSSLPFPVYGPDVGRYRFLALFTIFYHLAMLVMWAWLVLRLTSSRLIAALSLIILLASPELWLWMPQSETRFVVMPLVFLGVWCPSSYKMGQLVAWHSGVSGSSG